MTDFEQLAYSNDYVQFRKMDLFRPDVSNGSCLLFIHGGGWSAGSKEQWHDVCRHFVKLGFVCASISYRLLPDYIFPSQIEDARLAMQFLKRNAAKFEFDPQSIAVVGSSAGGYLAVMLGLIAETDALGRVPELEMKDTKPQAVIGYCPVVTLYSGRESAHQLMGGTPQQMPESYMMASPDKRAESGRSDFPPYLLIQGNEDETTTLQNTSKFCHHINTNGGTASLIVLPGIRHGFGYGIKTTAQRQSIAHVELFLERHRFGNGLK